MHFGVGSPQVAPIVGTGQSVFALSPTVVQFGKQMVNTPVIGYLSMGNNANYGNVTATSVTVQGSDFKLSTNGVVGYFEFPQAWLRAASVRYSELCQSV